MDAFGRRSRPASYPSSSSSRWSGSASGWAPESSTCTSAGPDVAPAQPARREDTSTHVTEKLAQPTGDFLDAFGDVSAAVESGAGLPEIARAAERALGATIAVVDRAGNVLAVAAQSPDDERSVLSGARGRELLERRGAGGVVGGRRYRARGAPPPPALVRRVGTLVALGVARSPAPGRASRAAVSGFWRDLLDRRGTGTRHHPPAPGSVAGG